MNAKESVVINKKSIDARTVIVVAVSLSSLSVFRQIIFVQLLVFSLTTMLFIIQTKNRVGIVKIFARLRRLIPVIISLSLLQLFFRVGGDTYFEFYFLKITQDGLFYAVSVGMRVINLVLIAGLLFDISSSDYLIAFKTWRIPYEISFLITSILRFIPDYLTLFQRYREALLLRSISLRKLSMINKIRALIVLVRAALIEALHGVTFRAISLDMKRFRLHPQRTYLYDRKLSKTDFVVQIIAVLVTAILIITI